VELWLCPASSTVDLAPIIRELPAVKNLHVMSADRSYAPAENAHRLLAGLTCHASNANESYFTIFHDDLCFSHRALDRIQHVMTREISPQVGLVSFYTPVRACKECASSLWPYSSNISIQERAVAWRRTAAEEYLSFLHSAVAPSPDPVSEGMAPLRYFLQTKTHWCALGHNPCLVGHTGEHSAQGHRGFFEYGRQTRNFPGPYYDAVDRTNVRNLQNYSTLISCLCVTQGSRIEWLTHAIIDFQRQSYPTSELVIVARSDTDPLQKIQQVIATAKDHRISLHYVAGAPSLGALRNVSVQAAHGPIICQWDDDDRYHPDRLMIQYEQMTALHVKAVCLSSQIYFVQPDNMLYWVDRQIDSVVRDDEVVIKLLPYFPGSLMAYKSFLPSYPETGEHSNRGEDKQVLLGVPSDHRAWIDDHGYLYLRRIHGTNTWHMEHHLFNVKTWALNTTELRRRKNCIDQLTTLYKLPKSTKIAGRDGVAWTIGKVAVSSKTHDRHALHWNPLRLSRLSDH
jgi:hypothetical protein